MDQNNCSTNNGDSVNNDLPRPHLPFMIRGRDLPFSEEHAVSKVPPQSEQSSELNHDQPPKETDEEGSKREFQTKMPGLSEHAKLSLCEPSDAQFLMKAHKFRYTSLHDAVFKGNVPRILEIIKESPSSVHAIDTYKRTPIFYACMMGSLEIVEILQKFGALIFDVQDIFKQTPLDYSFQRGQTELINEIYGKTRGSVPEC